MRGGSGREQGSNRGQWKSGARKSRACSEKEQRKETTRGGGCNWLGAGATREEESEEVVKVKRAGGGMYGEPHRAARGRGVARGERNLSKVEIVQRGVASAQGNREVE